MNFIYSAFYATIKENENLNFHTQNIAENIINESISDANEHILSQSITTQEVNDINETSSPQIANDISITNYEINKNLNTNSNIANVEKIDSQLNIQKLGANEISYSLLTESKYYKPFRYSWAYEAWFAQQKMHWLPEEVTMSEDIRDWKDKLTSGERNLLTQIFRFFTQSDIEVNNCYMMKYQRVFGPIEIKMMLSAFSNMETIHIDAYSKLIETIGMPETTYSAFLQYKEMKDKYEYMQKFDVNNLHNIALTLAVFGAFTEGLQLFSSFAILLNFPRFNKMKGMGQIVTWSVRDESLHTASIIKLFKVFLQENPQTNTEQLRGDIYRACTTIVHFEDAFIDRAFEVGDVHGLRAREVKQYIRYLADRRLLELGLKEVYMIENNPLPWLEEMLNTSEFANFFETRATTYAKSSTEETWEQAFNNFDNTINSTTK